MSVAAIVTYVKVCAVIIVVIADFVLPVACAVQELQKAHSLVSCIIIVGSIFHNICEGTYTARRAVISYTFGYYLLKSLKRR